MITETGVYDLSNQEYHSQECADLPSISSTGIRTILNKSPAHFFAFSDINPNPAERTVTKALSFGNAAHSLNLEGVLPEQDYALQPFLLGYNRNEGKQIVEKEKTVKGEKVIVEVEAPVWTTATKKAWKEEQADAGKLIVSFEDFYKIWQMRLALEQNPLIAGGLFKGDVEKSYFWKDEENGCYIKFRGDLSHDNQMLIDYKTTVDASPAYMEREAINRGYHIQLALGADIIQKVTGQAIEACALFPQEKEIPYLSVLYPFSDQYIDAGFFEYQKGYEIFTQCLKTGEWPGYPDRDLHLPGWHKSKLEAEGFLASEAA